MEFRRRQIENRADRAVQLLGLAVARSGRARFIEEWQADIAAARSVGLTPLEIIAAAARVAVFLFGIRIRIWMLRRHDHRELLAEGTALGFVFVVTDVQLGALVPFVLLALGWRLWRWVRAWIDGDA